jgi:hypothetical protein
MSNAETEAFNQAYAKLNAELHHPTIAHGPDRLLNIRTGQLEPGGDDKKYAIVSYIFDPSKLPEYPRLKRRTFVSRGHASIGEAAPNEGRFRFGIPASSPDPQDHPNGLGLRVSESFDKNEEPDDGVNTAIISDEDELALWEYTTDDFDAVVRQACSEANIEGNWLVQVDEDFEKRASKLAVPELEGNLSPERRAYIQEICRLVSCEADRRDLDHIWMDFICIDQADAEDKARQIPRLTDYFRKAEVCVVVSEMVRRRFSHRLNRLGADVLNAERKTPWECVQSRKSDDEYRSMQIHCQQEKGLAWEQLEEFRRDEYEGMAGPDWRNCAGYSEEERRYRNVHGTDDEIAGWLIGFHEFRVWTFQETLLAKQVIHVGGNLRINTAAALVIEDYWREHENPESRLFPVEWLPTPYKFERLLYLRALYLDSLRQRFPLPTKDFLSREHESLYVKPGEALKDAELSTNQCLAIIHKQQRTSLFEQDKIYGILGLFPSAVRFAMPARYDISLGAVFAILTYLRICNGDLYAFFVDEDRAAPQHNIAECPSWLPKRHGQMRLLASKPLQEPVPKDDPLEPAWAKKMIQVEGRRMILTAPYLDVAECADPGRPTTLTIQEKKVGFFSRSPFWLLPKLPSGQEETLIEDQAAAEPVTSYRQHTNVFIVGPQDFSSGNYMGRPLVPPVGFTQTKPRIEKVNLMESYTYSLKVDWSESLNNMGIWDDDHWQEILQTRRDIAAAVAAKRAVMVNFGYTKDGTELWLVLITRDEGKTWRKAGNVIVDNKMVKGYEKFGLALRPWQKSNNHARTFVVL